MLMTSSDAGVFARLGGLPFVDERFQWRTLLAAVAVARLGRSHGDRNMENAARAVTPEYAERIYGYRPEDLAVRCTPTSTGERRRIAAAIEHIAAAQPHWRPLLTLPVRFAK